MLFAWVYADALTACVNAPFVVDPPPPVPEPARPPRAPTVHSEPTELTPVSGATGVGESKLKLKAAVVGLVPIADAGEVRGLHAALLKGMLAGGFGAVLDLEPAARVLVAQERTVGPEQVALYGVMRDVAFLAPVSRARLLISGEVVEVGATTRELPVRFWYEKADLDAYQSGLEAYVPARTARLSELDAVEQSYSSAFRAAEKEYQDARSGWQASMDLLTVPQPRQDYDTFLKELRETRRSMPEELQSAKDLQGSIATRQEVREAKILTATLRLRVSDPTTGEVLAILDVRGEGRDAAELEENLVAAAVRGLAER